MDLFSVVYFIDDNTVECVPTNWIKNGTCAWPSKHTNAHKMIDKRCKPNKNEFNYYKIRELCSNIKTLAEAQAKVRKAQFTSDLSDDDYIKKKKVKRNVPNSMECPIYSDSDGNEIMIIPENENINEGDQNIESRIRKSVTHLQDMQSKVCYDMKDSGSKKIPENQLQYLTNSQSSDTVVNNYESSSTPTKIKDLLVEKSPNLKNDKPLLIDVSYNKSQKSLFWKGRGWSPSPFKKQWSPSPKRNKDDLTEISPTLNRISKLLTTDNSYYKVQRNLLGKSGRNSSSPFLKLQSSSSPKQNKEAIKKQPKFKHISNHDIEEPIKIYLAQAPFAEKRKKSNE